MELSFALANLAPRYPKLVDECATAGVSQILTHMHQIFLGARLGIALPHKETRASLSSILSAVDLLLGTLQVLIIDDLGVLLVSIVTLPFEHHLHVARNKDRETKRINQTTPTPRKLEPNPWFCAFMSSSQMTQISLAHLILVSIIT